MLTAYRRRFDGWAPIADRSVMVPVDLLPCPLCGIDGEQQIHGWYVSVDRDDLDEESARGRPGVECGNCGVVVCRDTAAEACRVWNDRSREPEDV